jgi:hypothetical protein
MFRLFRHFYFMKRLVPVALALALFAFAGCDSSDSDSNSGSGYTPPPILYSVYLYDGDLDLRETVSVTEGGSVDLDAKSAEFGISVYGWYEGGSAVPLTGDLEVTDNITLYAAPSITEVSTESELDDIRNDLTGKYILKNDIALTSEWEPIGDDTAGKQFGGILQGGGYKITGVRINSAEDYIGLFGYIEGGVVKNLGVETANEGIRGAGHVGGITGRLSAGGRIENSYTAGSIFGTASIVGGIAGELAGSEIKNSYSAANVIASDGSYSGGIAGTASASLIEKCYFTGSVRGLAYTGGIVGRAIGAGMTVDKSYSTGTISATQLDTGGIVGFLEDGIIRESYSAGNIIANGTNTGGIVGAVSGGSSASVEIINCYSTAYVAAGGSDIGGIAGTIGKPAVISGSYFAGVLEARGGSGGGIVGQTRMSSVARTLEIKNSFFSGYMTGGSSDSSGYSYGGIVGYHYNGGLSITNSYSAGTIDMRMAFSIGGILGQSANSSSVPTITITDNVVASPALICGGKNYYNGGINRIVGVFSALGTAYEPIRLMAGNLAYEGIATNDTSCPLTNPTVPENHGTDAALATLTSKATYTDTLFWEFFDATNEDPSYDPLAHPWKWGAFEDYPYPTLYWQTERP